MALFPHSGDSSNLSVSGPPHDEMCIYTPCRHLVHSPVPCCCHVRRCAQPMSTCRKLRTAAACDRHILACPGRSGVRAPRLTTGWWATVACRCTRRAVQTWTWLDIDACVHSPLHANHLPEAPSPFTPLYTRLQDKPHFVSRGLYTCAWPGLADFSDRLGIMLSALTVEHLPST